MSCFFVKHTFKILDEDSMNSWGVYKHYVQLHDLIQIFSLQKQFTSKIIDVQVNK
jgi:hypothetical protein